MKTRFYVQFSVKRDSRGTPVAISAKGLTKGPPSIRYDGIQIGFDISVPDAAFRIPFVAVDVPIEKVGQPEADAASIPVAEAVA